MNAHGLDFLMGCLFGSIVIPALVRLWTTGRLDGWYEAPRRSPEPGEYILVYHPGDDDYHACTYTGPDGEGDIPEGTKLYWRRFPAPPKEKT